MVSEAESYYPTPANPCPREAIVIGLVLASLTIGRIAFIVAGGVWSDRLQRRLVMLSADVVRAAAQAALAALLLADAAQVWHFMVAAFAFGSASAFFGPASTGLVPQTVSGERLQEANAFLSLSDSATHLAGPALSGLIVATVGSGVVFAIDAASFLVSAAFLALLRLPLQPIPARQSFIAEVAHGLRVIHERSWLIAAFLTFGVGNIAIAAFFVLGPLVVQQELGGSSLKLIEGRGIVAEPRRRGARLTSATSGRFFTWPAPEAPGQTCRSSKLPGPFRSRDDPTCRPQAEDP